MSYPPQQPPEQPQPPNTPTESPWSQPPEGQPPWGQQPGQPGQPPAWGATPPQPPPPPPKKKSGAAGWLIGIAVAVTALCLCGGLVSEFNGDPTSGTSAQPTRSTTTDPASPTASASPTPSRSASPTPKPKPPKKHKAISERKWKLVAKNPDKYQGERYIVFGWVTQFDSATGPDTFRADVGGDKRRPQYGFVDYPTNTVLTGDEDMLADLVQGDLFKAKVTVLGSLEYETQIGGSTTVPLLQVDSITVTGSTG